MLDHNFPTSRGAFLSDDKGPVVTVIRGGKDRASDHLLRFIVADF